jgi:CDP-diglyceride synthetase
MIEGALFGIVAGLVVALAGSSISEQPIKTIALIVVLCLTHVYTKKRN